MATNSIKQLEERYDATMRTEGSKLWEDMKAFINMARTGAAIRKASKNKTDIVIIDENKVTKEELLE